MSGIRIAAAGFRELARALGISTPRARSLVERHPEVGTKAGGVLLFSKREVAFLAETLADEQRVRAKAVAEGTRVRFERRDGAGPDRAA